jgi:hypothetical protein
MSDLLNDINLDIIFSIKCPYQTSIRENCPYITMDRDAIIQEINTRIIHLPHIYNGWIILDKPMITTEISYPHIVIDQLGCTVLVRPLKGNNNNKEYTVRILGHVYGVQQDILILDMIPGHDKMISQQKDISFDILYRTTDPLNISVLFQSLVNRINYIEEHNVKLIQSYIIDYPDLDADQLYKLYRSKLSIWAKILYNNIDIGTWKYVYDQWNKCTHIQN